MKLNKLFYLSFILVLISSCSNTDQDLYTYVNPFIGTGGHGHTYPGVSMPHGMVQLSPDTRTVNWDACSGYHYSDSTIIGFSHKHLSGTGAIDYGDIRFMPVNGNIVFDPGTEADPESGYRSRFSHEKEKAGAAYYSVLLKDYDIQVELTCTPRVGIHQYIFPENCKKSIIVDLLNDLGNNKVLSSGIKITAPNEIRGYRESQGWAHDQKLFFAARFSEAFESYQISLDDQIQEGVDSVSGTNIKAAFSFKGKEKRKIRIRVALSAVSEEGAMKNLLAEAPDDGFENYVTSAQNTWNKELGRIKIKDQNKQNKEIFYTALYHSLLAPNTYSDVDGYYRGMDGLIHKADHEVYTVFSLWDTFRATHPLLNIIDPDLSLDLLKTLLLKYQESGFLPVWELSACETGCMIAYHSVPVIADALAKGLDDFDIQLAYEAMKNSAMQDHLGMDWYKKLAYIPADKEHEAVSKTLEYAYDDWCIARVAKYLGKEDDYHEFTRRALSYRNLYDSESGFMRGKKNGAWSVPFDPYEVSGDYTEANAWQYSYFVPQDIKGLIQLMGGDTAFCSKLDELFSASGDLSGRSQPDIAGLIGQYAHGNEPSHHMAYLYAFAGQAWKSQKLVNQICSTLYTNQPDGLSGNEDCGQMSSWYNFSALGFYPVSPGLDYYVIGSPLFNESQIQLPEGKSFKIIAHHSSSENIYIQSVKLNGKNWDKAWIRHGQIMAGGVLEFEMGPKPNKELFSSENARPVSRLEDEDFLAVPVFNTNNKIFKGENKIEITSAVDAQIYYTFADEPTDKDWIHYSGIFPVNSTCKILAKAKKGNRESASALAEFYKIPAGMNISIKNKYSHIYTAGGDLALIDGQRGDEDFRSAWQGYQGDDVEVVIDLGKRRFISSLSAGFLQNQGVWIFLPSEVKFLLSDDGTHFETVKVVLNPYSPKDGGAFIHDFYSGKLSKKARYVKVIARNIGECPAWHKGAGGKAWIFADEIVIKP